MRDTPKDGGTAFPHLNPNFDGNWDKEPCRGGMTLRDYFAAAALQGWLASYNGEYPHPADDDCQHSVAILSYRMADAMLAAKKEKPDA